MFNAWYRVLGARGAQTLLVFLTYILLGTQPMTAVNAIYMPGGSFFPLLLILSSDPFRCFASFVQQLLLIVCFLYFVVQVNSPSFVHPVSFSIHHKNINTL